MVVIWLCSQPIQIKNICQNQLKYTFYAFYTTAFRSLVSKSAGLW